MAFYDVIDAGLEHVEPIARIARQADIDEVWAQGAVTVRDALRVSIDNSAVARVGRADGVPGVIYGVVDRGEHGGLIWMIGTKLIDQHRRGFLDKSRSELDDFQRSFSRLWNYVDVRNKRAVHWLIWLGFELHGPMPYGVFGKSHFFFDWQYSKPREVESNDRPSCQ